MPEEGLGVGVRHALLPFRKGPIVRTRDSCPEAALAVASLVLLMRFRVNSVWLIAGGAAAGELAQRLR